MSRSPFEAKAAIACPDSAESPQCTTGPCVRNGMLATGFDRDLVEATSTQSPVQRPLWPRDKLAHTSGSLREFTEWTQVCCSGRNARRSMFVHWIQANDNGCRPSLYDSLSALDLVSTDRRCSQGNHKGN